MVLCQPLVVSLQVLISILLKTQDRPSVGLQGLFSAEISSLCLCLVVSLDFWLHLTQLRELVEFCWGLPSLHALETLPRQLPGTAKGLTYLVLCRPSLPDGSFWKLLFYKTFFFLYVLHVFKMFCMFLKLFWGGKRILWFLLLHFGWKWKLPKLPCYLNCKVILKSNLKIFHRGIVK